MAWLWVCSAFRPQFPATRQWGFSGISVRNVCVCPHKSHPHVFDPIPGTIYCCRSFLWISGVFWDIFGGLIHLTYYSTSTRLAQIEHGSLAMLLHTLPFGEATPQLLNVYHIRRNGCTVWFWGGTTITFALLRSHLWYSTNKSRTCLCLSTGRAWKRSASVLV